jgi:hypothetical protein
MQRERRRLWSEAAEEQGRQMIKSVIACALMMQLSMATKLEMARLFPEVASYCMAHPSGQVSVSYRFEDLRSSLRSGRRH